MKSLEGPPTDPQNPKNFELSQEQWNFMYQYYPEYCAAPYEMMAWLRGQARAREAVYAKPGSGGVPTGGAADEEEEEPQTSGKERPIGFESK